MTGAQIHIDPKGEAMGCPGPAARLRVSLPEMTVKTSLNKGLNARAVVIMLDKSGRKGQSRERKKLYPCRV